MAALLPTALVIASGQVSDPAGAWIILAHVVLWPALTATRRRPHLLAPTRSALELGVLGLHALLFLGAASWFTGTSLPPALLLLVVSATVLVEVLLRALSPASSGQGSNVRRVLVAGHPEATKRLAAELTRAAGRRITIVGSCRATADEVAAEACRTRAHDVVLLPCPHLSPTRLRALSWRLADQGRDLHVAPELVGVGRTRTRLETHSGLTLLRLDHSELRSVRRTLLQGLGRVSAAALLVLLAPLWLLLSLAIMWDSPGPVLFRQERVGAQGRRFTMVKFRTMRHQADQLAPTRPAGRFLFKLEQDPRVTRVGAWLRRYSLDELPQLINVARGEMSLIGPRPALPEETMRYADEVHRRLAVRPGMTGLWQVSGRSDLSWEETVRLDLDYVDNWTPSLDLRILLRTVSAVLSHRGAY